MKSFIKFNKSIKVSVCRHNGVECFRMQNATQPEDIYWFTMKHLAKMFAVDIRVPYIIMEHLHTTDKTRFYQGTTSIRYYDVLTPTCTMAQHGYSITYGAACNLNILKWLLTDAREYLPRGLARNVYNAFFDPEVNVYTDETPTNNTRTNDYQDSTVLVEQSHNLVKELYDRLVETQQRLQHQIEETNKANDAVKDVQATNRELELKLYEQIEKTHKARESEAELKQRVSNLLKAFKQLNTVDE